MIAGGPPIAVSSPAAVVVFAYKRRDHLERTLASLLGNDEAARTNLHVFCDAARTPADRSAVEEVRRFVSDLSGFASVTRVMRDSNMGLAASIIDGVTRLLEQHDRVIVVEDDLVLSRHFLRYMNDALETYAQDEAVASIHGYSYPTADPLPETFFLRGADCWGWATWRRAWAQFRPDGTSLLAELRRRRLTRRFDLDGSYPYTRMLKNQTLGRNDSWAIRWHASCFLAERLTLYPGRSLVHNIGNDSSGTHSGTTGQFDQVAADRAVEVVRIPLLESVDGRAAFVKFFRRQREPVLQRVFRRLQGLRRRLS